MLVEHRRQRLSMASSHREGNGLAAGQEAPHAVLAGEAIVEDVAELAHEGPVAFRGRQFALQGARIDGESVSEAANSFSNSTSTASAIRAQSSLSRVTWKLSYAAVAERVIGARPVGQRGLEQHARAVGRVPAGVPEQRVDPDAGERFGPSGHGVRARG